MYVVCGMIELLYISYTDAYINAVVNTNSFGGDKS